MKYIKKYEIKNSNKLKFKIGDLIIPILEIKDNKLKKYLENKYGKITHVYKNNLCEIVYENVKSEDIVELMYYSKLGFHKEFNINTREIDMKICLYDYQIRHLTDEELNNYIIKRSTKKYNL